jgi:RNA polymerase sigma-70 factor (ECF subfamily)
MAKFDFMSTEQGVPPTFDESCAIRQNVAESAWVKRDSMTETPIHPGTADESSERAQLAADWERARTAVFAQLVACIGSFHDAEDVLQEVAVSVAKNYGTYDPSRPFVAWALGIARNHMLMYFRKHQRDRLVFNEHLMRIIGQHLEAIAEEHGDHRREALHKCLNQLNADRRHLIDMRYSSGLSVEEMAHRLDKSIAAVKGSLHRVRRALEKCVSRRTSNMVR